VASTLDDMNPGATEPALRFVERERDISRSSLSVSSHIQRR